MIPQYTPNTNSNKFRAAFYRGKQEGIVPRLVSSFTRARTGSPYSHCEILFSDGFSGAASLERKGVFLEQVGYSTNLFSILYLPDSLEPYARWFVEVHRGRPYDLLNELGFKRGPRDDNRDRLSSSELVACALRISRPELFSPATLYATLEYTFRHLQPGYSPFPSDE